ncbi:hypothetical protein BYT27DRAFT_7228669 [Phlegmacium glaucopus]|nr:hypothetical protein BYT27DRAFT_7228669 [Phlegmacium glaucopus]
MTVNSITDNSLAIWSWLSAGLLAILSAILTLSPRLLLFLSESAISLTPLEAFLALHFGIVLATLALTLVLNVPSPKPPVDERAAPSHPLLSPLTIAANLSAFFAWNTRNVGALASIVFFISITIGLWGLWTIVFANSGSISKSTGADKHTSSFIFGNQAAASSQKKRFKKGE